MPPLPVKSREDVKRLGTILSVWAHPDDESFTCAGIMAAAVANGQRVVCVTATRGELGLQDESRWPARRLAAIRTAELRAALDIIGIVEHYFLDYPDGGCHQVPLSEGADKIAGFIKKYQPDTILTFGPDGLTGHTDHGSVSKWAGEAARAPKAKPRIFHAVELRDRYEGYMKQADKRLNIYFNIDKPPLAEEADCAICFSCDPDLRAKKVAALKAMPSQTDSLMAAFEPRAINDMLARESFVEAK